MFALDTYEEDYGVYDDDDDNDDDGDLYYYQSTEPGLTDASADAHAHPRAHARARARGRGRGRARARARALAPGPAHLWRRACFVQERTAASAAAEAAVTLRQCSVCDRLDVYDAGTRRREELLASAEHASGTWVRPCECRSYAHRACLEEAVLRRGSGSGLRCAVCGAEYKTALRLPLTPAELVRATWSDRTSVWRAFLRWNLPVFLLCVLVVVAVENAHALFSCADAATRTVLGGYELVESPFDAHIAYVPLQTAAAVGRGEGNWSGVRKWAAAAAEAARSAVGRGAAAGAGLETAAEAAAAAQEVSLEQSDRSSSCSGSACSDSDQKLLERLSDTAASAPLSVPALWRGRLESISLSAAVEAWSGGTGAGALRQWAVRAGVDSTAGVNSSAGVDTTAGVDSAAGASRAGSAGSSVDASSGAEGTSTGESGDGSADVMDGQDGVCSLDTLVGSPKPTCFVPSVATGTAGSAIDDWGVPRWLRTYTYPSSSTTCSITSIRRPSWPLLLALLLHHQLLLIYFSPRLQAAVTRVWTSPFVTSFIRLFLFFLFITTLTQAAFIRIEAAHALAVRLPWPLSPPALAVAWAVSSMQELIASSILLSVAAWAALAAYITASSVLVYIYWRTHYRVETLQNATYKRATMVLPSFGCIMCSMGMCLDTH